MTFQERCPVYDAYVASVYMDISTFPDYRTVLLSVLLKSIIHNYTLWITPEPWTRDVFKYMYIVVCVHAWWNMLNHILPEYTYMHNLPIFKKNLAMYLLYRKVLDIIRY